MSTRRNARVLAGQRGGSSLRAGVLLAFALSPAFTAAAQTDALPDASEARRGREVAESGLDPALVELGRQLDELLSGTLPESVLAPGLFGVPLDDPSRISARIDELHEQVAEAARRISEMRKRLDALDAEGAADTPPPENTSRVAAPASTEPTAQVPDGEAEKTQDGELPQEPGELDELAAAKAKERAELEVARRRAELEAAEQRLEAERAARAVRVEERARQRAALETELPLASLRLQVAEKRLRYLKALQQRLARMTDASRRILPTLGEPRVALRDHAAKLVELSAAVDGLAARMDALAQRSGYGVLVGFVSEQRALETELGAAAASYRQQARRFESTAADLASLSETLETHGRKVRAVFFRTVARSDSQGVLDDLFLTHLKSQRRLRKSISEALVTSGRGALEALRVETASIVPVPRQVGTTGDARQVLDAGVEHRLRIESLLAAETAGAAAWELAFENELLTVLSEQASDAARTDAHGFSRELLDDLSSEVELAWARTVEGIEVERTAIPSLAALATTPAGQEFLLRFAGVLGMFGAWLLARRQTPRLAVLLIKLLARASMLRARIGLLVRWSGLVQSVLPAVLALAALWCVLVILGEGRPVSQGLQAVVAPVLVYVLGRQILIGATKRITPGRPALIELQPATLDRLQRTYATLGIVVCLAYILDGVARVAIGAGQVVELLDGLVMVWIGVWGIWEARRYRVPLARAWTALTPDAEEPSFERRVAKWMEGTRLGFVLSPVAFARIAGTPIAGVLRALASGTDLVQSLRARLLRRRSMQSDGPVQGSRQPLPAEYLEGFPLYPILGDDESLFVLRDQLLDEISQQWRNWQQTRVDGSLVLIGEKGTGKTTLAAQIAKQTKDIALVQYTVSGKPTTGPELIRALSTVLRDGETSDLEELTESICQGDEKVVVVDEAHNVFLRHVDGYGAYDALVDLVNATSSKVFWVLVFNSFTWRFLNESRGRAHYFRKLLYLPKWTPDEIQRLIRLRNKRTGFDLSFDDVLLSDTKGATAGIELVEEADGYFRLLWESSGGNPRIATQLWLSSLRPLSENSLGVGLFPEPSTEALSDLQDDLVFSLAAICQHENLSSSELARVLNVSDGFARFAMQFLAESGFVEEKDSSGERFTLAPTYYRAVLRVLRNKHLLFD